jgi:hypothetical protein
VNHKARLRSGETTKQVAVKTRTTMKLKCIVEAKAMKPILFNTFVSACALWLAAASLAQAEVPSTLSYQGRVQVEGNDFTGTGQFKFALVSQGPTYDTYWSNDGTSTGGSEPADAVSVAVNGGLFTVLLGDTTLAHMQAVPTDVFVHPDVHLRIWFNDGTHGFAQLAPDQPLSSVGYAMRAGSVDAANLTGQLIGLDVAEDTPIQQHSAARLHVTHLMLGHSANHEGSSWLGRALVDQGQTLFLDYGADWPRLVVGSEMTLFPAGNIGIGTDNPQEAVDVAGTVKADALNVGEGNSVADSGFFGTYNSITGGRTNRVLWASDSFVGGGVDNRIDGQPLFPFQRWSQLCTIGGGQNNGLFCVSGGTIGGGQANHIDAEANASTISGGMGNSVQADATRSTIGGGYGNVIGRRATYSVIGGGNQNHVLDDATECIIPGGCANEVGNEAIASTIGGGYGNVIGRRATYSTISGGNQNRVLDDATECIIPGGCANEVGGIVSFAAGFRAKATHDGCFVWGDLTDADIATVRPNTFLIRAAGGVGINTNDPQAELHVNGTARVKVLQIEGGADVAEPFEMSDNDIPKGAVVIIDEENPGRLKMSERAYDTRVAGIVSGANGISSGLTLSQYGVLEGGQNVALSGRVYVLADANNGAIKPGDLLTTSDVAGHAMKVTDHVQAQGAILGKAMTALAEGRGYVLVLVSLQ